jgi:hypothetical protein
MLHDQDAWQRRRLVTQMSMKEVSLSILLILNCYWMTCPLRKSPNISSPVYCYIVTRHEGPSIFEAERLCAWRLEAMCIQPCYAKVPGDYCLRSFASQAAMFWIENESTY